MRLLLTGSTGFLGAALAHAWVSRGHELLLLARPHSNTSRIDALEGRATLVRFEAVEQLAAIVGEFAPDAIVHTACAYGRVGESTVDLIDANVRLGVALLDATTARADRRTVFLNTGTVLAPSVSLYALSKLQFSAWGSMMAAQHPDALQFIDVRLQQMYGRGDDTSKFTTHVLESCRNNAPRLALTPGEQQRDFIHIDDVVQAYETILQQHHHFGASDVIDVGSGAAVRMRDFVELAKRLTNSSIRLDFGAVPYRPTEAMLCVADIERLTSLGWRARFDLDAGLRETLNISPLP